MTIIVVEHVMKAILAVSDQVLVLNAGQRLMLGPPREVLSDPQVIEAYLGHKYATRQAQQSEAAAAAVAKAAAAEANTAEPGVPPRPAAVSQPDQASATGTPDEEVAPDA
jgi:ABC-type glutathione transport system ATPase component